VSGKAHPARKARHAQKKQKPELSKKRETREKPRTRKRAEVSFQLKRNAPSLYTHKPGKTSQTDKALIQTKHL
jgi:hypothetical protein